MKTLVVLSLFAALAFGENPHIGNGLPLEFFASSSSTTTNGQNSTRSPTEITGAYSTTPSSSSCGGTYSVSTSSYQYISSPGWPNNYPNNADCRWTMDAAYGYYVSAYVISFRTESDCDYLTFYDGNGAYSSNQITQCSGTNCAGHTFYSSSSVMTVTFISDHSSTYSGFKLRFIATTYIPPSTTCNCGTTSYYISTYGGSQTLRSPTNYPSSNYPNNCDCTWHFSTDSDQDLQIYFYSFNTEFGDDIVTVYDSSSTYNSLETCSGSYCSSATTSGNYMTVTFTSDNSGTDRGFSASVSAQTNYYYCSSCLSGAAIAGIVITTIVIAVFLVVLFAVRRARLRRNRLNGVTYAANTATVSHGQPTTMFTTQQQQAYYPPVPMSNYNAPPPSYESAQSMPPAAGYTGPAQHMTQPIYEVPPDAGPKPNNVNLLNL